MSDEDDRDDPTRKQVRAMAKTEAMHRAQMHQIELQRATVELKNSEVNGELLRIGYALQLLTMTANLRGAAFEEQRRVAELFVKHSTERVLGV